MNPDRGPLRTSWQSTFRRLAMRIRYSAIVLALSGVAACNGGGEPAAPAFAGGATANPLPAGASVSPSEAKNILDRYERLAKQASSKGKGWEAAEAGLSLQLTNADTRMDTLLGERRKGRAGVDESRFAIPASGDWFLAEYKTGSNWTQLIFQQTTEGWRVVSASATRPPAIAKDGNGYATALNVDERGGLAVSPRQAATAHARLMSTLGADAGAKQLFAAGDYTTELVASLRSDRQKAQGQWNLKYQPQLAPEVFALKTSAGGAVVWYGMREQDTFTARPGAAELGLSQPNWKALSRGTFYKSKVTMKSGAIYVAVIPPSSGKVRVISQWFAPFNISGS
ncbi:hypothetical protein [Nonomuraea sp. NPDC049750]|uniref:hypothetical protein n=1 Tax=Nonomuraea sp. NPDC049750 TaxID=3154738 RepID=UPI0033DCA747